MKELTWKMKRARSRRKLPMNQRCTAHGMCLPMRDRGQLAEYYLNDSNFIIIMCVIVYFNYTHVEHVQLSH